MKMRKLIAFFYPDRCPYCGAVVEPDAVACDRCRDNYLSCRTVILRGAGGCRCVSSFEYTGKVRRAIIHMKFHHHPQFARQLALLMVRDIRICYRSVPLDAVTYVPMYIKDEKRRGYNQSKLLAKTISEELGIPMLDLLIKVKQTRQQHKLSYRERKKNLRNAFCLTDPAATEGRTILLIDDITTSGATLAECIRTLTTAHPALICCAAIANAGAPVRDIPRL